MKLTITISTCAILMSAAFTNAQDWPQWMGPNRDAKAASFKAPKTWPKELTEKWKVSVGDGVATPSLVGDKLYVFARQDGGEIVRCLDAASGKELWRDKYEVLPATGSAQSFSGPRCTPTVADGKVITLGLRGTLTCYDADSGKVLWRKEDFKGALPRFFTSASPLVADGLCIAHIGGNESGGVVAYDIATGDEKWKWDGAGPAYASPVLLTVAGTKMVVAETEKKIVGLGVSDGKLLWETPFPLAGRGYNASCPIVVGQTLIYCGSLRGVNAVKIEKEGDAFIVKELWKNMDNSVQFNTPIVKDGYLYGYNAANDFFCIDIKDGKTVWSAPSKPPGSEPTNAAPAIAATLATTNAPAIAPNSTNTPAGTNAQAAAGGQRGGGGNARMRSTAGYGSIVDAGNVLLALTPSSELIAFKPDKSYTELARIKVASTPVYTYPVVSGNRVFVKDQDNVILWTIQ